MDKILTKIKQWQKPVIGLGVTGFSKISQAFLWPNYYLVCFRDSLDLNLLASKVKKIICLQRLVNLDKSTVQNSLTVLTNPIIQKQLQQLGSGLSLFCLKSGKALEKICNRYDWKIINNRSEVRDALENKLIFSKILKEIKVEQAPWELVSLKKISWPEILNFKKKFGPKVVLKLPEVTKGGGLGVCFVEKETDFNHFKKMLCNLKQRYLIKQVMVTKFINGYTSSIIGCCTKWGVLSGVVQTPIFDQKEVINLTLGNGLFCGHDWSYPHKDKVKKQAYQITKRFGEYIYAKGYRGIFGLDLLVDKKDGKVYACECNPRYTASFPVYTLQQIESQEIPFDVFHFLEHLNLDYQIDIQTINNQYKQKKEASQLILNNKENNYLTITKNLPAGIYEVGENKIIYKRSGFAPWEIKAEKEFIWTDGCPKKGSLVKPFSMIGKLIFKKGILKENGRELKEEVKKIVGLVYRGLGLQ